MADVFRIITLSAGGRPVSVLDMNDGTNYFKMRDSMKLVAPARNQQTVSAARRYSGSTVISETLDNTTLQWTCAVKGSTPDLALAGVETLVSTFETFTPGDLGEEYIEFRPTGATSSVYYEIRGPATWTWNYEMMKFSTGGFSTVDLALQVAPLALLPPMDIRDDFALDSSADYAFDSGAGLMTISAGGLNSSGGSLSTERRMIHTARGHTMMDMQATIRSSYKVTSGFRAGLVLRRSAANNYIIAYVDDSGAATRVRIDTVVAGTATNIATTSLGTRLGNGALFWIRGRVEGRLVFAEYFTTPPTPMGTPANSTSATLTAADSAALTAGYAGIVLTPISANLTYPMDDFEVLPYTYRNRTLPDTFTLGSTVPGTASALADVSITHSGGARAPQWAMLGWSPRPATANYVWNGHFEASTGGWRTTSLEFNAAPTSLTRLANQPSPGAKFGTALGEVVTAATTNSGPEFKIWRPVKAGTTYTLSLWARSAVQTTSFAASVGHAGATDTFTGTAANLSIDWQQYTVTYTPTADRNYVVVAPRILAATATTFQIDGVMLYEGTTAPTGRQAEGAGAQSAFGIIDGEGVDPATLSASWALTADAGARAGTKLWDASSVADNYAASWWIDPSLLPPDAFSQAEVDVEFWGRIWVSSTATTPNVRLSAIPEQGINFGAERFTAEYGTVGQNIVVPLTSCWLFHRFGTITFPTTSGTRWQLTLTASNQAGSSGGFGMDYLVGVPSRARAAGASAKSTNSYYPSFIASTAETTRLVTSDLRGSVASPPNVAQPIGGGMGGALIELTGNPGLLVKLSSLVPDDPAGESYGDQLAHSATVHLAVQPRVFAVRGT